MDAITISSLTKDDEKEALEHLQKFLYIDEPIKNTLNSANPLEYDDVYSCLLKNDISFKAVNGDGKIVGLLINKQLFKNDRSDRLEKLANNKEKSEKFRIFCGILDHVTKLVNLFELYPEITTYIDAAVISIDSDYRHCGLGRRLMEHLLILARDMNVKLVKVSCSSLWTYKLCLRLGFKKIACVAFNDINLDPLPRLFVPEPHTRDYTVVKEII